MEKFRVEAEYHSKVFADVQADTLDQAIAIFSDGQTVFDVQANDKVLGMEIEDELEKISVFTPD